MPRKNEDFIDTGQISFTSRPEAARRLGLPYSTFMEGDRDREKDWHCLHRFKRQFGKRWNIPTIQLDDHCDRVAANGQCAGGCVRVAEAAIEAARRRISERLQETYKTRS